MCVYLWLPSGSLISGSSSRFNFGLMFFHPGERPLITTNHSGKKYSHTLTVTRARTHTHTHTHIHTSTTSWCIVIVLCPLSVLPCSIYSLFWAPPSQTMPWQRNDWQANRRALSIHPALSFLVMTFLLTSPVSHCLVSVCTVCVCDHNSVWMALHPAAKCPLSHRESAPSLQRGCGS